MIKIIKIPFNSWSKERLLNGKKVCTSRTRIYGNEGDIIDAGTPDKYTLKKILKLPLWFVTDFLWLLEGADSSGEFVEVWKGIHPNKGYDGFQMVYVHFFTNPRSGGK